MDLKKCLTIGLVLGVVANVIDFVVQGNLMAGYYKAPPFSQENSMTWFIVGDFVSTLVFAWFYLRFASAVAPGAPGGVTLGFYAGVLVSFPTYIFFHLMVAGIPYGLMWIWTLYGIAWYIVLGAIAGAMNKR